MTFSLAPNPTKRSQKLPEALLLRAFHHHFKDSDRDAKACAASLQELVDPRPPLYSVPTTYTWMSTVCTPIHVLQAIGPAA